MTPDAWVILGVIAVALGIAFNEDNAVKIRVRGGKHRTRQH
jgi:hypothetical protein